MAVLGICLVVLAVILLLMQSRNEKRRRRAGLLAMFGKKRESAELSQEKRENIARLYQIQKDMIPEEELVDEITWDDLEMDKVFAQLNHTVSFAGEQYLYLLLHRTPSDVREISRREQRVQAYDRDEERRVRVQTALAGLAKQEINYYVPDVMQMIEMQRISFARSGIFLFASLVVLAAIALVTRSEAALILLGVNVLVNLVLYAYGKNKYEVYLESLYAIYRVIRAAETIGREPGGDGEAVRDDLKALGRLSKLTGMIARKKQSAAADDVFGLLYDYALGALMWDFIIYDRVITELAGKQEAFMRLFSYVGETDACIAIASYRRSKTDVCIPEITARTLHVEELCHPLMEGAVPNSFTFEKNALITGSNASGKSTFIKAVAINLILGQTINTCTAKYAVLPSAGVLTSMAIRDDVMSGESYYMREIKYLKRMVTRSTQERLLFFGIDEILRGTNTKERIAASYAIMQYLKDKNCMLMVATHDLALAKDLDGVYKNYYFCESVAEDGDVAFDFLIREGISTASNAIRLLDSIGFPREITETAAKMCRE